MGLVAVKPGSLPDASSIPQAPSGVSRDTKNSWVVFWSSEVASLVVSADYPALERLFKMYDERDRLEKVYKRERLTTGAAGQMVMHPAEKAIASLDSRILALEDRFGITPKGRLQLGVTFGAAVRSLEELNRAFDDDDETDPRLSAVDTGASEAS